MITKIIIIFSVCLSTFFSFAADLQGDLTEAVQTLIPTVQSDREVDYVNVAREIQYWIFVFVGIIAVAYIIYIGTKLLWAPGSMEEMESSLKSVAYVGI